ncbi:MAG: TolB family protein [Anaerolineae bacterium]
MDSAQRVFVIRRAVLGIAALALSAAALVGGANLLGRLRDSQGSLPATVPGRLAYLGVDGNIYTLSLNDPMPLAVTTDGGEGDRAYLWPTWSLDGARLGFAAVLPAEGGGPPDRFLITTAPDGSEVQAAQLGPARPPFYLYWSPDGRHLSFLTEADDGGLSLGLAESDGGAVRYLYSGSPIYFAWAPDGRRLLLHSARREGGRLSDDLFILPIETGRPTAQVEEAPGAFRTPAWSQDGESALFATGEGHLVLSDVAGASRRRLAEFEGSIAFEWSPREDKVAYLATESTELGSLGTLRVLEVETGAETTLGSDDTMAFFWAPNGEKVAYLTAQAVASEQDSEEGRSRLLLTLHAVDVETGVSESLASFFPARDFAFVLPFFDQYAHSLTFWSPDSRYFVYAGQGEIGGSGIWVVDVETGTRNQVAVGSVAVWSWQ